MELIFTESFEDLSPPSAPTPEFETYFSSASSKSKNKPKSKSKNVLNDANDAAIQTPVSTDASFPANGTASSSIASSNRKTLSYSDILKNMNLVLVNGKLEFAKKSVHFADDNDNSYDADARMRGRTCAPSSFSSSSSSSSWFPENSNPNSNPNPAFYSAQQEFEWRKLQNPNLTKKEFLKGKVIDHLVYRKELARVAATKSSKMIFTAGNAPVASQDLPSIRNLNSLFTLKK
jgi:hypothetical protein